MAPLCPPTVRKTEIKVKLRKHEHLMDILHAIRRRNEILKKVSTFDVHTFVCYMSFSIDFRFSTFRPIHIHTFHVFVIHMQLCFRIQKQNQVQ